MIRIKMMMAFIAEFLACIKSLPVSCSWQCAKLKAVLHGRKLKIEQVKKEGARAYLCDKKLLDNPYHAAYLAFAWDEGYLYESDQWHWQRED